MLLALQERLLVNLGKLRLPPFRAVHLFLVGVHVISKIPIGIIVLGCKTVGINGSVRGPGMDFDEREIFVDEKYAIGVFLQHLGEERLVHAGAERALEIVIVDDNNFGIFVAARGSTLNVDFLHHLCIGVLREVQLGHADESLAVLGKQEIVILFLIAIIESDGQGVVIGEIARFQRSHEDLNPGRDAVIPTNLPFDYFHGIGWSGLSSAAEADEQEDKERAS